MTGPAKLDESDLNALLAGFYDRVRQDDLLGPVFNGAVADWDDHLARIADFWSSLLTGSGRYKGDPIAMHMIHADRITPAMFLRWLDLWDEATARTLDPVLAAEAQARARRVGARIETLISRRNAA